MGRPSTNPNNPFRLARLARQLSIEQVVEEIGGTRTQYYNYEKGIRFPEVSTLTNLANLYKTSIDFLCGRSDVMDESTASIQKVNKDMKMFELDINLLPYIGNIPVKYESDRTKIYGYGILDPANEQIVFADSHKRLFSDVRQGEVFTFLLHEGDPIKNIEDLKKEDVVDVFLIEHSVKLSGDYKVFADEGYVKDEKDRVFSFNSFNSVWFAFKRPTTC